MLLEIEWFVNWVGRRSPGAHTLRDVDRFATELVAEVANCFGM
jgi:hypothetical protein